MSIERFNNKNLKIYNEYSLQNIWSNLKNFDFITHHRTDMRQAVAAVKVQFF